MRPKTRENATNVKIAAKKLFVFFLKNIRFEKRRTVFIF